MAKGKTSGKTVPEPQVVWVTQLATLAALVDGEATEGEIETIGSEVAKAFPAKADDVKTLATQLVESHKKKNLVGRPMTIVKQANRALTSLSGPNKRIAMRIANTVIEAGGTDAKESQFITELRQQAFSPN